jgi:hypothetical protein
MKTLLCTLILATLGTAAAKADTVTISFDQPNQTAIPGQTLEFFGTITNLTSSTIFLNSDDLDPAGLSISSNDLFFTNAPISLAPAGQPGSSSGDIELFDLLVTIPLQDAPGLYSGTYDLIGGPDDGKDIAQDVLGSANFSVTTVTTVPEPSTIYLLLSGASALFPIARRMRSATPQ